MNIQQLTANISNVAGVPVEITIRGERNFTFSFDGESQLATAAICAYFTGAVKSSEVHFDMECDATFIYINA